MADGINISVGIDGLGIADQLAPRIVGAVESAISTSLAIIRDHWVTEAQNKLRSTRTDYLMGLQFNSIQVPFDGPLTGAVVLLGDLPNSIERGYGPFDMKPGFSRSGKVTQKKDGGWFLTIPFRHSTPGSTGTFGSSMGKDVYGVAKQLSPYKSGQANGSLSWAGAADQSWNGYQHKSNTASGMVRIVKSYNKATQSQYMTFRRVSDQSDPASWHHPGYGGAHIAEKLAPFARSTFEQVLTTNLNNI